MFTDDERVPPRTGPAWPGTSTKLIIKMLIFTRFLKGFGEMISFHDNDKFLPLGGTRRNARFSTVFGGSRRWPVGMCATHGFAAKGAGNVTFHRLIWDHPLGIMIGWDHDRMGS